MFGSGAGAVCHRLRWRAVRSWSGRCARLRAWRQTESRSVRSACAAVLRVPAMNAELVARARDEADLCRNEGAADIAELLDELAAALDRRPHEVAQAKLTIKLLGTNHAHAELRLTDGTFLGEVWINYNPKGWPHDCPSSYITVSLPKAATHEVARDERSACGLQDVNINDSGKPYCEVCNRQFDDQWMRELEATNPSTHKLLSRLAKAKMDDKE